MKTQNLSLRFMGLALASITCFVGTAQAEAPIKKTTLCVYDPAGGNGDVFNMMKDYKTAAIEWGVEFTMKPYTDEKTVAEDFKAGKCGAALITGTRARAFHKFAGTMEAMGALPEYDHLKSVIKTLSRERAAELMKSGDFEVAAQFPGGAVYLFVRDRAIDTVSELAGKRMATLDFDEAAKMMVRKIGASMVAADVGTFAGMFNNGSVDAAYAPAVAYKALELYKGLGDKGGIIQYPLAQVTLQLIIRTADFPADFGKKSRAFAGKSFKRALKAVKRAERGIKGSHWIKIPDADKAKYDQMFLDVRVHLRDKEKIYNKTALKLMRKVRCMADGSRAECAKPVE